MTAVTATNRLVNGVSGVASPITTASFTFTAGRLYLFFLEVTVSTGSVNPVTITDSLGNTWEACTEYNASPGVFGGQPRNIFLFRTEATTGGSGTITITTTGTLGEVQWICEELAGQLAGNNGRDAIGQIVATICNADDQTATGFTSGQAETRYLEKFQDATNNLGLGFTLAGQTATAVTWNSGWTSEAQRAGGTFRIACAKSSGEKLDYSATWSPSASHMLGYILEVLADVSPVPGSCSPQSLPSDTGKSYTRAPATTGSTTVITTATCTLVTGHVYLVICAGLRTNNPLTPTMSTDASGWTFTEIGSSDTRDYNTIASPDIRLNLFTMHGGTGAAGRTVTGTYASTMTNHPLEVIDLGLAGTDIDTSQGTQGIIQTKGAVANSGSMASATLNSAFTAAENTLLAIGAGVAGGMVRPAPPTGCRLLNRQHDNITQGMTNAFAAIKRRDPSGAVSFSFPVAGDNAIRLLELAAVTAGGAAELDGTETVSATTSDTAGLSPLAGVTATETASATTSDTAGLALALAITATETVSATTSDTAGLSPVAGVTGTEATSSSHSDTAGLSLSLAATLNGTESVSATTADIAGLSPVAGVTGTPEAVSSSHSDTAGLSPRAGVTGTEGASSSHSNVAGLGVAGQIDAPGSVSASHSDTATLSLFEGAPGSLTQGRLWLVDELRAIPGLVVSSTMPIPGTRARGAVVTVALEGAWFDEATYRLEVRLAADTRPDPETALDAILDAIDEAVTTKYGAGVWTVTGYDVGAKEFVAVGRYRFARQWPAQ